MLKYSLSQSTGVVHPSLVRRVRPKSMWRISLHPCLFFVGLIFIVITAFLYHYGTSKKMAGLEPQPPPLVVGVDWFGREITSAHTKALGLFVAGQQRQYRGPGVVEANPIKEAYPYSFIRLSGYRISPDSFVGIGAGAVRLRGARRLGYCTYKPFQGGAFPGRLYLVYPGEHHGLTYEVVLVFCEFTNNNLEAQKRGELYATIDGHNVFLYREDILPLGASLKDEEVPSGIAKGLVPTSPFKHEVVICSPPIYGKVNVKRIHEFIEYHLYMGVSYFVIYDLGVVDTELAALFKQYETLGMLEVVHVSNPLDWWCSGHVAFINDCNFRNTYTAKWVLYLDFDEYFHSRKTDPRGEPENVVTFLSRYDDQAAVSLGSLWWSTFMCHPPESVPPGAWAVERMAFHWPHVYCVWIDRFKRYESCLDQWGHRKVAANPRKTRYLQIHMAQPKHVWFPVADVDASDAVVFHWRGLIGQNSVQCNETMGVNQGVVWWTRGQEMIQLARKVRAAPFVLWEEAGLAAS